MEGHEWNVLLAVLVNRVSGFSPYTGSSKTIWKSNWLISPADYFFKFNGFSKHQILSNADQKKST